MFGKNDIELLVCGYAVPFENGNMSYHIILFFKRLKFKIYLFIDLLRTHCYSLLWYVQHKVDFTVKIRSLHKFDFSDV